MEHFGSPSTNGPATEARDVAGENRALGWKEIPVGCPAEIRARIVERRQQILSGNLPDVKTGVNADENEWREQAKRSLDSLSI